MLKTQNAKDYIVKIVEKNPLVKDIFKDIDQVGGTILLVGGAVRDFFGSQDPKDYDFEVYHLSLEQLQEILERHGRVSLVGSSFGVLRLFSFDADFSLPRKDSSGRKPEVFIDKDMEYQDAFRRRDVTVNAMGIDCNTFEVIDPFGGLQDLEKKMLRSPDLDLFHEDPLRLFRVMQFAGRFDFSVDSELSDLCRTMDVSEVSRERIEDEFKKLWLRSQKPSIGLKWLQEIGRFAEFFPDVAWSEEICRVVDCVAEIKNNDDSVKLATMWSAFFVHMQQVQFPEVNIHEPVARAVEKQVQAVLKKYILSIEQKRMVLTFILYVRYIPLLVEEKDIRWHKWLAWWIQKSITVFDLLLLAECLYSQEKIKKLSEVFEKNGILHGPEEQLLQGRDLLDYAEEGPELGALVKRAYGLQIDEGITDKEQLFKKTIES